MLLFFNEKGFILSAMFSLPKPIEGVVIIIEGFNWFFQALREFRGITLPKDKMFL